MCIFLHIYRLLHTAWWIPYQLKIGALVKTTIDPFFHLDKLMFSLRCCSVPFLMSGAGTSNAGGEGAQATPVDKRITDNQPPQTGTRHTWRRTPYQRTPFSRKLRGSRSSDNVCSSTMILWYTALASDGLPGFSISNRKAVDLLRTAGDRMLQ